MLYYAMNEFDNAWHNTLKFLDLLFPQQDALADNNLDNT